MYISKWESIALNLGPLGRYDIDISIKARRLIQQLWNRHAMRHILFSILFFCMLDLSLAQTPHSVMPKEGLVPTAEVAIRIAVAVWEPIYGQDNIERQKPYTAKLVNGIWRVEGSLSPRMPGGVALAEISQTDGRVLRVSHGK